MSTRSHLSIGEVLNLLQDDFPDVTISKIRFLESQGLLDPERTPSGYRKFYDTDIERLRWILRQQRENFLPLKVIKDRLASDSFDASVDGPTDASSPGTEAANADTRGRGTDADDAHVGAGHNGPDPALLQEAPASRGAGSPPTQTPDDAAPVLLDTGETSISMTLEELTASTGLTARDIGDLERFGMITNRSLGGTTYYDEDAIVVARVAAGFRAHGVEARHLRMYRVAAEREAGVFEQLLNPLARKRTAAARQQSGELVNELAALGGRMRSAMLRQLLREYVDGV